MSGDPTQKRLASRHPAHCLHDADFVRLERLAARSDRSGRRMAARLDLACAEVAALEIDETDRLPARAQAVFESLDDAIGVGECVLLQVQNGRTWGFGDPVKASADAWQRLLAQGDEVREGVALAEIVTAIPGLTPARTTSMAQLESWLAAPPEVALREAALATARERG